jgi:D-inositol-3-phosphate glycosyltransferase
MKIVFIEPSGAGGIAHYTYALANALSDVGVASDILTGKRWVDRPLSTHVKVHPVFQGKKTNPFLLIKQIMRCRNDASLVHWQSTTHPELLQLLMRLLPIKNLPWIFTVHNVLPHEKLKNSIARYGDIYRRMRGLIFHTHFSFNEFQRIFPGLKLETDIIPLGEYGFLTQKSGSGNPCAENTVLFFGNIRHYKGLDVLIEAFAEVRKSVPHAKLKIVGQALEPFAPYQKQISRLQLDQCVETRLEYIPDEDIPQLLDQSIIVSLPYRHIDQSAVLLLALSSGKAVVASNVGGLEEVIRDQETGILVPPENPAALSQALISLLLDRDKAIRMGNAARVDANERFSWSAIAAKTVSFYERVV